MGRQFAGDAEIAAGAHEAGAEHFLPEAIDRDARRQRMLRPRAATWPARAGSAAGPAASGGSDFGVSAFTWSRRLS